MNESTQQLINTLAEKFGTTAEHLWGVLVQQAPISSFTDATLLVIATIISVVLGRLSYSNWKIANETHYSDEHMMPCIISGALSTVFIVIVFVVLYENLSIIIAGFINPEYWALQKLLGH